MFVNGVGAVQGEREGGGGREGERNGSIPIVLGLHCVTIQKRKKIFEEKEITFSVGEGEWGEQRGERKEENEKGGKKRNK